MNFQESFQRILEAQGTNANLVAKNTGISVNTIYTWTNKGASPALDKLVPIADFLNVSLDELAGRVPPQHTEQEVQLLNMFKKLPDTQKQEVLNYVDFILSK